MQQVKGSDDVRKTFSTISTVDELNIVNDKQKANHTEITKADPSYTARRIAAYVMRWKEAIVYAQPGMSVLDIGAGHIPDPVWDMITGLKLDYHAVDIDPNVVAANKARVLNCGMSDAKIKLSTNTSLPFGNSSFDYVFSSHCLEHSDNLIVTFSEIRRVLKPSGTLFFAVPFGFDLSDEHLVFLEPEDWVSTCEQSGFYIVNGHIGVLFTDPYADLVVVARKDGSKPISINADFISRREKKARTFIDANSAIIKFPASAVRKDDGTVFMEGIGASFTINEATNRSLICVSHNWSGIVRISNGMSTKFIDLYCRYHHLTAIDLSDMTGTITVDIVGKNEHSKSTQIWPVGVLVST